MGVWTYGRLGEGSHSPSHVPTRIDAHAFPGGGTTDEIEIERLPRPSYAAVSAVTCSITSSCTWSGTTS